MEMYNYLCFLTYYLDQIRKIRKWNGDESSQREYYLAHVHRTVIQMVKQIQVCGEKQKQRRAYLYEQTF